jgi:tol-pal system protein YbgF
MLSRGVSLLAVLLLAVGSGCATRDQFLQMREELYQVRRVLADTRSDVQAQQRDLQALRGDVDAIHHRGGHRTSRIEMERVPSGAPSDLPADALGDPSVATTPAPTPAAQPGEELARLGGQSPGEDEYRTALALVQQQDCNGAIPQLRSYLRKYPDTPLSDNAQYWIGECYYTQRDFNNAILAFYDVTRRYPKGDKVCAAMLKQGLAFAELGDAADARIVLERLIQSHPECSDEVNQARVRLGELQQG